MSRTHTITTDKWDAVTSGPLGYSPIEMPVAWKLYALHSLRAFVAVWPFHPLGNGRYFAQVFRVTLEEKLPNAT